MEHGFHGASLRRISADSGVSTNSIYTRFGDKAGLFAAVVGPVADGLMGHYLTCVDQATDTQDSSRAFCRSAGTEYEQYFDRLAQIEETYYRVFADKYAKNPEQITDFFVHVVCRTGWQYIYEIVSHKLPFEEAKVFMDNIKQYRFAGWKAVLDHE